MTDVRNEQVVLAAVPKGELKASDLRWRQAAMPVPDDGEVLLETVYLSIDPYMRWWMRREKSYHDPIPVGAVMIGATVSRVRRSRHPAWAEGDWVLGWTAGSALDFPTEPACAASIPKPPHPRSRSASSA